MDKILYGCAYYDEYMPYDRLDQDVAMMKKAGINVVRIAESTWSTCEPQPGVFDFSHVTRVLDAMEEAGISVIIGTPTYAIPTWMVKQHPDVLAERKDGSRPFYGARQIMDITHPVYLFYAERVIRELMKVTAHRSCVIGFQVDNETKYYGACGKNIQEQFIKYLREKFHDDLDALNAEFGFDYWSNRINAWEDFPDVRGTINGSFGAEFEKFQRTLVDRFLAWQAGIVNEYRRPDQFVTHNFDYEWRDFSFGLQPDVNHKEAAKALTIAGCDIYHRSQDQLTGREINFAGSLCRSLKDDNYLVIETGAQGYPFMMPYPGQLRLQAYSHIGSGANSVMYWHWHSLHNSAETFWKGLLSHDFGENETYQASCIIGNELAKIGSRIVNLKKKNDIAVLVSNEAYTALKWFAFQQFDSDKRNYNDVFRWLVDALYELNLEYDVIWPDVTASKLASYKAVIVPSLFAAPDSLLTLLNEYVEDGGTLLAAFRSGFANENVKVRTTAQPGILSECLGVTYHHFVYPYDLPLNGRIIPETGSRAELFAEILNPEDNCEVLAAYANKGWNGRAAVTKHAYGQGFAYYFGCMTDSEVLKNVLRDMTDVAGIYLPAITYPLVLKRGISESGKQLSFLYNFSFEEKRVRYKGDGGEMILGGEYLQKVHDEEWFTIAPWDVMIVEE